MSFESFGRIFSDYGNIPVYGRPMDYAGLAREALKKILSVLLEERDPAVARFSESLASLPPEHPVFEPLSGEKIRILEVAAGYRPFSTQLHEFLKTYGLDPELVVTDSSNEALMSAGMPPGGKVSFRRAVLPDLGDFEDGSFDVVLGKHFFAYLDPGEKEAFLREANRVLSRRGLLFYRDHVRDGDTYKGLRSRSVEETDYDVSELSKRVDATLRGLESLESFLLQNASNYSELKPFLDEIEEAKKKPVELDEEVLDGCLGKIRGLIPKMITLHRLLPFLSKIRIMARFPGTERKKLWRDLSRIAEAPNKFDSILDKYFCRTIYRHLKQNAFSEKEYDGWLEKHSDLFDSKRKGDEITMRKKAAGPKPRI